MNKVCEMFTNKYNMLIYLLFILTFISLWNNDNFNLNEHFGDCPKKYMDTQLSINKDKKFAKLNNSNNKMDNNFLDIETNKFGSEKYNDYPKESNYNFYLDRKKKI